MNIAKKLLELFKGLDRAHGEYIVGEDNGGKVGGKAFTKLEPTTVALWESHLAGTMGLGVIPIQADNTCAWGVVDIDDHDINVELLSKKVKDMPLVVCRSKSGGAHVFMFFKKEVPASKLRLRLAEVAAMLGYPEAEVFPKQVRLLTQKDVGNWLNMPYHDGDRTTRYCLKNGKPITDVEKFITYAFSKQITLDELNEINLDVGDSDLNDAPPCLSKVCVDGVPKGTGRNITLFSLGVYCKSKYGAEWESELEKMNQKYMQPPVPARELTGTIFKSLQKKTYFYKCNDQPLSGFCNKDVCKNRKYGIGGDDTEPPYVLGTLIKIDSDPPTWFIDVDGVRLELSTDDLLSQDKFRKLCVERINKLPKKVKGALWEKVIAERLEGVQIVEAPKDSGVQGRFEYLVEKFLARPVGASEGQLLSGKAFVDGGEILFRGPDLMEFLGKQRFYDFKQRRIWSTLRGLGATHSQRNIKGRCVQLWGMPMPKEQDEAHDVPDMTETDEPF